ncbi:MAG: hypothetical protein U5L09_22580 [Bacteroidales bacterium]|nr:hypothetical protein [Bacteroidales bacterium]
MKKARGSPQAFSDTIGFFTTYYSASIPEVSPNGDDDVCDVVCC